MPKRKTAGGPDGAKAAADAAYAARAARVMRWVVRLAILATAIVLGLMIEPLVAPMISGPDAGEARPGAAQPIEKSETERQAATDRNMRRAATILGGFVMLFLLIVLNFALARMEKAGIQRET